jgi:hypothetical protein
MAGSHLLREGPTRFSPAKAFWQREYYDRLIRDGDELKRALRYAVMNPERAGLKGWRWVWSAGLEARTTAGLVTGATLTSDINIETNDGIDRRG